ncbi:unnamed protein product [Wickerhamomyces anomalus]
MKQHFPTPTEAFGARNPNNQNKPVRKAPSRQEFTPPLHPQQPMSQHPRPVQRKQQQPQVQQQRYANQHPLPQNPRQQQYQQIPQSQPLPRPNSGFAQDRIASQPNAPGSPYAGYAPSAYNQLQQRNTSQPNIIQQQQPRADPAQILERQLRELFDRVDRDHDGGLTEDELATALINNDGTQFRSSTVRLMIRLFDKDGSGTIEFKEFFHLWNYILHWRKTFQKYDVDSNQKISFGEYQSALESFGYRLPTDIVLFIFQRFGDFNSNQPMSLRFDMFVESLVWLLRCTNIFKKFDTQGNGIATISFQDFVHEILSFI